MYFWFLNIDLGLCDLSDYYLISRFKVLTVSAFSAKCLTPLSLLNLKYLKNIQIHVNRFIHRFIYFNRWIIEVSAGVGSLLLFGVIVTGLIIHR